MEKKKNILIEIKSFDEIVILASSLPIPFRACLTSYHSLASLSGSLLILQSLLEYKQPLLPLGGIQ
jgi:hypothetical protein